MNIQVKKRNSDSEISRERSIAGWSKWPTRQAHDLKTAGSNPAPALHVVSSKRRLSYNNPCVTGNNSIGATTKQDRNQLLIGVGFGTTSRPGCILIGPGFSQTYRRVAGGG